MLRVCLLVVLMILPVTVKAEMWFPIDGSSISKALNEGHIIYDNGHRQSFYSDGTTEYSSGSAPEQGLWRIEGDFYCSQWPPQDDWDCYTVSLSDQPRRVLFTGTHGDKYFGKFR